MHSTGPYVPGTDAVDVTTTYFGDWGWRTTFTPGDDGGVLVRHFNSGPDIPEYLCVEFDYHPA
jgi:hypothetical protein